MSLQIKRDNKISFSAKRMLTEVRDIPRLGCSEADHMILRLRSRKYKKQVTQPCLTETTFLNPIDGLHALRLRGRLHKLKAIPVMHIWDGVDGLGDRAGQKG